MSLANANLVEAMRDSTLMKPDKHFARNALEALHGHILTTTVKIVLKENIMQIEVQCLVYPRAMIVLQTTSVFVRRENITISHFPTMSVIANLVMLGDTHYKYRNMQNV